MKIIACLGNPGPKYRLTRHNIGFLFGEYLASEYGISPGKKGFSSVYGTGKSGVHDILVMFPQTFMNLSGQAVQGALGFYREDAQSLIVIHDEIELPFGEIRKKTGGGHKGHNGLRSIIQCAGSAEFERLRIGVGRPADDSTGVADYVLGSFSSDEQSRFPAMFKRAKEELEGILG
jgi:PTH1 family peptidyl-tRNA hydrolase